MYDGFLELFLDLFTSDKKCLHPTVEKLARIVCFEILQEQHMAPAFVPRGRGYIGEEDTSLYFADF
jgi:hypothetical protein